MAASVGVRVLVVSAVADNRKLWEQAAAAPGVENLATAANLPIGLAKPRYPGADLVVLDVEGHTTPPGETMEAARAAHPGVQFLLTGSAEAGASREVAAALAQRALDFVTQPSAELPEAERVRELQRRLIPLVGLCLSRRFAWNQHRLEPPGARPDGPARVAPAPLSQRPPGLLPRVEVVVIAVSTGGPEALGHVLPRLPGDLGVPVLVVQHMPEAIAETLALDLASRGELPVRVAVPGDEILPNRVYLAPGGRHLLVERPAGGAGWGARRTVAYSDAPPENSVRPAADVLFRSVAAAYDGTVLAVIMTGMGADGCAGVKVLKEGHCYCITQTANTCAVYGMPRSVDEAGLGDERVPLDLLADRIAALVAGRR